MKTHLWRQSVAETGAPARASTTRRAVPGQRGSGLAIALLVAVLLLTGCSSGASEALERRAAAVAAASPTAAATEGVVKTSGDVSLTVHGVQSMERGSYVSAKEGNTFLVIDVTLKNQGQQEVTVGSRALVLKDAAGTTYRRSMSGGSKPSPDSTLPPGGESRGELAYEIPKSATGLQLTLAIGEPVTFDIKQ